MDTWVEQLHSRADIVKAQISQWITLASTDKGQAALSENNQTLDDVLAPLYDLLKRLYSEELPIARLKDASDLFVHAEGPSTDYDIPSLKAVTWIADHVQTQLRKLTAAILPLTGPDAEKLARKMGWSFAGYAPGSIVMGFSLRRPEVVAGFEDADTAVFNAVASATHSISLVPKFIEDESLSRDIVQALPDPAVRDAAMIAAMMLSPTRQSGIDKIEIASPYDYGTLSQHERGVLREALKKPISNSRRSGSFIGRLRVMDLDKNRVILRRVETSERIDAIRCVLQIDLDTAKQMLGERVKVTGTYETLPDGRPRLLYVEEISHLGEQQTDLSFD